MLTAAGLQHMSSPLMCNTRFPTSSRGKGIGGEDTGEGRKKEVEGLQAENFSSNLGSLARNEGLPSLQAVFFGI
jgi:hypothetical protein